MQDVFVLLTPFMKGDCVTIVEGIGNINVL